MNDIQVFSPLALAGAIGFVWQWARAPKNLPNWISYAMAGLLTAGAWFFVTKDAGSVIVHDWRSAVAGIITMYMTSRGAASTSADVKAAPKTDSK